METEYLKDFMVFAETMNYTAAAKKLYISQPTLSSHIAALEKEIGVPLVKRNQSGLFLTPAGKHLQSRAEDLLGMLDNLIFECQDICQKVISLNIRDDTAFFGQVMDCARNIYCKSHPDKKIETNLVASPYNREETLDKGLIDFDIGRFMQCDQTKLSLEETYNVRNLNYFPQCKETLCFWTTSENVFSGQESIRLADLQGKTMLTPFGGSDRILGKQVQEVLCDAGIKVELSSQRFNSLHEYYMTDTGYMLGIVGESIAQSVGFGQSPSSRRVFQIEDFNLTATVYTVYRGDLLSADKLEFIDALRAVADTMLAESDEGNRDAAQETEQGAAPDAVQSAGQDADLA